MTESNKLLIFIIVLTSFLLDQITQLLIDRHNQKASCDPKYEVVAVKCMPALADSLKLGDEMLAQLRACAGMPAGAK